MSDRETVLSAAKAEATAFTTRLRSRFAQLGPLGCKAVEGFDVALCNDVYDLILTRGKLKVTHPWGQEGGAKNRKGKK